MNGQSSNDIVELDNVAGPCSSSSSTAEEKRAERMKRLRELHLRRVSCMLVNRGKQKERPVFYIYAKKFNYFHLYSTLLNKLDLRIMSHLHVQSLLV